MVVLIGAEHNFIVPGKAKMIGLFHVTVLFDVVSLCGLTTFLKNGLHRSEVLSVRPHLQQFIASYGEINF